MKPNFKNYIRTISCSHGKIFFLLMVFPIFSSQSFSQNSAAADKKINIAIHKDATLEELETIKGKMETEGFGFEYSNVAYNDSDEIISITIQYSDANNNSGKYSVNSKKPINSIVIVSEGNSISVKSEGPGNQNFSSQGNGNHLQNNNEKSYTERKLAIEARREQMKREMQQRKETMEQRRERVREQMQQRRDSLLGNARENSDGEVEGTYNTITKTTTDEVFAELKKSYAAQNISFSLENLKRNQAGEITHISITIDNGSGSVSTSGFGNGSSPIANIQIMADGTHTVMRNME